MEQNCVLLDTSFFIRLNDTKMFAQADVESDINFYGTADVKCKKVYDMIKNAEGNLSFSFIDITLPHYQFFENYTSKTRITGYASFNQWKNIVYEFQLIIFN